MLLISLIHSDWRQTESSDILFIWIEQSIDLSVHSFWSLERQRFCCLLGFFLKQEMETLVILKQTLSNPHRDRGATQPSWFRCGNGIICFSGPLPKYLFKNRYLGRERWRIWAGNQYWYFFPYLIRIDKILLTDGTVIFSSSQLQNIPDISPSSHDCVCYQLSPPTTRPAFLFLYRSVG